MLSLRVEGRKATEEDSPDFPSGCFTFFTRSECSQSVEYALHPKKESRVTSKEWSKQAAAALNPNALPRVVGLQRYFPVSLFSTMALASCAEKVWSSSTNPHEFASQKSRVALSNGSGSVSQLWSQRGEEGEEE